MIYNIVESQTITPYMYCRLLQCNVPDNPSTGMFGYFPYSSVIFLDDYVNLWCIYTQKEAFPIKNALRGSLVIGIIEGFGKDYENYTSNLQLLQDNSQEIVLLMRCSNDSCRQHVFMTL